MLKLFVVKIEIKHLLSYNFIGGYLVIMHQFMCLFLVYNVIMESTRTETSTQKSKRGIKRLILTDCCVSRCGGQREPGHHLLH